MVSLMTTSPQPLSGSTWILIGVFLLSGAYVVIGHIVLYVISWRRVKPIRSIANLPFYAVALYFSQDRAFRTKGSDIFAISGH